MYIENIKKAQKMAAASQVKKKKARKREIEVKKGFRDVTICNTEIRVLSVTIEVANTIISRCRDGAEN